MSAHPILVLSADWQTRALLAAQLGKETGRDVLSAPGVDEALALTKRFGLDPVLITVDTGEQMNHQDVERLIAARPDVLMTLIVSALRRATFDTLREHCAAYLVRPVSIGEIVQEAGRLIHPAGGQVSNW